MQILLAGMILFVLVWLIVNALQLFYGWLTGS